jgi:hypothetical protein
MKKILNEQRRSMLANFMLNLCVASLAVSAFGDKPWGIAPAIICVGVFFLLTKE